MSEDSLDKKHKTLYDSRTSWPPYTYRDYLDINSETYNAYMEFLSTENSSDEVLELQPWISFCDSKCTFCYYQTTAYEKATIEPYLRALKKELTMYAKTKFVKTSVFDEIVLGGGTPSLLSAEQMIDLISFCEKHFNKTDDYMIKVTCSSRSLEKKKLDALAKYGVYQVDLGAQTFDDKIREILNLPDTSTHVEEIIRTARQLGFCVCIDLMYNLPSQTMESWINSVKKAIELDVEVDCYALDVYPGTILDKQLKAGQIPPLGDSQKETEMYLAAYNLFSQAGYKAVGHDRFSRDEWHFKESCLNGWPWAGILTTGAGCFMGYLRRFSYSNIDSAKEYIESVQNNRFPIARLSESNEEEMMKRVMTKLYLRLPINKKEFFGHFNKMPEDIFSEQLGRLEKKGLIEIDDKEIRITKQGEIWKANIAWEFANPPNC